MYDTAKTRSTKLAAETRTPPQGNPLIVLYDGVCVLCNRTVRFILKRDHHNAFQFAPLQGSTAKDVLERHETGDKVGQSVVVVKNLNSYVESILVRSDALLFILAQLGPPWRFLSLLRILPRKLRDAVYDLIANRRYRWFGRYESCPLPTEEQKKRFLP